MVEKIFQIQSIQVGAQILGVQILGPELGAFSEFWLIPRGPKF